MIQINKIFQEFPEFETENLFLKAPNFQEHSSGLLELFREKDIVENYLNPNDKVSSLQDINNYIQVVYENFIQKKAISWVIIEKKTNKLIGIRDLYFDGVDEPAECQGCISKNFRRKGYSKECYRTFFKEFAKFGVTKYSAKCNGQTLAPIKLMYSLGFLTTDIAYLSPSIFNNWYSGWTLTFLKDLQHRAYEIYKGSDKLEKEFHFFLMMFLRPSNVEISRDNGMFLVYKIHSFNLTTGHTSVVEFGYDKPFGNPIILHEDNTGSMVTRDFIIDDNIMSLYDYIITTYSK